MDKADRDALARAGIIAGVLFLAIVGLGIALGIATRLYFWAAWG